MRIVSIIAGVLLLADVASADSPGFCLAKENTGFAVFWHDQIACANTSWKRHVESGPGYVCGIYNRERAYAGSCRESAGSCWRFDTPAFFGCMTGKGYKLGSNGYRMDWRVKLRKGVCGAPPVNLADIERDLDATTKHLDDAIPSGTVLRLSRSASCSTLPR